MIPRLLHCVIWFKESHRSRVKTQHTAESVNLISECQRQVYQQRLSPIESFHALAPDSAPDSNYVSIDSMTVQSILRGIRGRMKWIW